MTEIKEPNEETRNEQNTISYECTRIFIEQHKQHDDTTWGACNITTTTTMKMKMRQLADVDHHARGRELRGVSTSPENKTRYRTILSLYVNIKE